MKTQSTYLFLLSFLLVFFSCTDDPESGCIDELACNYNSEAEEDDGSCEYITCSDVQILMLATTIQMQL